MRAGLGPEAEGESPRAPARATVPTARLLWRGIGADGRAGWRRSEQRALLVWRSSVQAPLLAGAVFHDEVQVSLGAESNVPVVERARRQSGVDRLWRALGA
ncbi:hypothetical protein GCM10027586_00320 [Kineococcus gypseus]